MNKQKQINRCSTTDCDREAILQITQLNLSYKTRFNFCVKHFTELYAYVAAFNQHDETLLGIKAAAVELSVHPETLRRWDRLGVLKAVKVNKRGDRKYRVIDIYEHKKRSL